MSSFGIEARVGVFVLTALLVLIALVLVLGDISFASKVVIHADYAYAGGLQVGAPVKVSGVRVGRVRRMALLGPNSSPPPAASASDLGRRGRALVRVDLALEQDAVPLLTQGARLAVGTAGVIGESYVELTPGAPGAASLADGSVVRGVDAPRLHVMALQLASMLNTLGGLLGTDEQAGELQTALTSLLTTAASVVGEHREELGQAVSDVAQAAGELRAVLAEVRAAIADGRLQTVVKDAQSTGQLLAEQLPSVLAQAKESLATLDALGANAKKAMDPDKLAQLLADAQAAAHNFEAASRDARQLAGALARGEGTVGGLLQDPQIYDDTKELLRDLKHNPWKLFWRD